MGPWAHWLVPNPTAAAPAECPPASVSAPGARRGRCEPAPGGSKQQRRCLVKLGWGVPKKPWKSWENHGLCMVNDGEMMVNHAGRHHADRMGNVIDVITSPDGI